ncbi:hypothetical protein DPEC_G00299130 [Dallia pectoralis]|uniref:Uncharacterized protein n=1 Tax=Dallia pectoralis TaxID=75939 RepID=A0ACC2FG23_DALPE|nr:hypothetical protein DPEC_G00299130 [Dallia pectoralis]
MIFMLYSRRVAGAEDPRTQRPASCDLSSSQGPGAGRGAGTGTSQSADLDSFIRGHFNNTHDPRCKVQPFISTSVSLSVRQLASFLHTVQRATGWRELEQDVNEWARGGRRQE